MRFVTNSMQNKFILVVSCFVLFILTTVISTLYVVNSQTTDAEQLNIASRQQVLIVQLENETNALILALESASSVEERRQKLNQMRQLFDQSLTALQSGGEIANDINQLITLPPADTKSLEELQHVANLWKIVQTNLDILLDPQVDILADNFYDALAVLHKSWQPLFENTQHASFTLEAVSKDKVQYLKIILLSALILTLFVAILAIWFGKRTIVKPTRLMLNALNTLLTEKINFAERLPDFGTDEIGKIAKSINAMRQNLQNTYERIRQNNEAAQRINQALDKAAVNILISDNTHTIIYLNEAAQHLFNTLEQHLREHIPNFNSSHLLNSSTSHFPTHQIEYLESLKTTYQTEFVIGHIHLQVIITPVISKDDERLGWITEWRDKTVDIAIEQEVNHAMRAAETGDFSQRVDLVGKTGFYKVQSAALNRTLSYIQQIIEELHDVFNALATGNLNKTIVKDYQGSLAKLKTDLNSTVNTLTNIIQVIQQTADAVNHVAGEISESNQILNQRTEQQAAALEETATNMTQMTESVQKNAQNARMANQMVLETRQLANESKSVLEKAILAMQRISQQSQKITEILSVIDDIAFQTNLLALNAAIEAARAGEQGRGFSVVAAEVRYLAQRSATAAKEIKELIKNSVTQIEEGKNIVNNSGVTLQRIASAVQTVSELIATITTASQEQADGIQQVSVAITQMEAITQQNASLVEEANNISQAMRGQAQHLQQQIAFFNIETKQEINDIANVL
ncbi:methyl-accepting chemotaxis protein [Beggiatoa alba B18LD]|uniref:Methyl-accepting chemotaxis protein n=1 Tax=Beggiatoa alba B18LD TaxID=395493 RepID=I3CH22_9GAMM|nr:methyl-accepting chemotaxis protein [Beggiatoa alba]EIJ42915.1 methyl-accepting chemotaxis protein [Beggiatoa alba B18LD]